MDIAHTESVPTAPCTISMTVPEDQLTCSFILSDMFQKVTSEYSVFFKFRIGCINPRNVDGTTAWTTVESVVRRSTQDIRLTYKVHDGGHIREDYVPLSSIEPCPPTCQPKERALVIRGEHFGKIVFTKHFAKNESKQRIGMHCTLTEKEKKKNAIIFPMGSITRLRDIKNVTALGD